MVRFCLNASFKIKKVGNLPMKTYQLSDKKLSESSQVNEIFRCMLSTEIVIKKEVHGLVSSDIKQNLERADIKRKQLKQIS